MTLHSSKGTDEAFVINLTESLFSNGAFGRPRVLVADDDPRTGSLLASTPDNSYEVTSVSNGRDAYRLLMEDAEFAVAIFDMTMPQLQGVDLLRHMKTEKRLDRIPVIIISGDQGLRNIADSFAAGAIAFLAKPFAPAQLIRTVKLVIGRDKSRPAYRRAA